MNNVYACYGLNTQSYTVTAITVGQDEQNTMDRGKELYPDDKLIVVKINQSWLLTRNALTAWMVSYDLPMYEIDHVLELLYESLMALLEGGADVSTN